jgi:hypothetical protein
MTHISANRAHRQGEAGLVNALVSNDGCRKLHRFCRPTKMVQLSEFQTLRGALQKVWVFRFFDPPSHINFNGLVLPLKAQPIDARK